MIYGKNEKVLLVKQLILLFAVLSVLSCFHSGISEHPGDDGMENDLVATGKSGGISWILAMAEGPGPYLFTDRIQIEVTLKTVNETGGDGNTDGSVLKNQRAVNKMINGMIQMPDSGTWGDFRVRRLGRSGGVYQIELIPVKTGDCRLAIPVSEDLIDSGDSAASPENRKPLFLIMPDISIQIDSVLEEGTKDAAGLIPDEKKTLGLLFIILPVIILMIMGVPVYFIFVKRRRSGQDEEQIQTLSSCLEELPELETQWSSEEIKDHYRVIFHLLLAELEKVHPGLKGKGYGPAELKIALEEPSSLNQWSLRSLYPMLEWMEDYFYAPHIQEPGDEEYQRHRKLLMEWITLLEEDSREV